MLFSQKNLSIIEGVEYDSSFDDFIQELQDVMESEIEQTIARKSLTIDTYRLRIT